MKDTLIGPGLPAEFPDQLRSAERRIREALGRLDLTRWQFAIKENILVGARHWAGTAIDTIAVVRARHAIGHRVFVLDGHQPGDMWEEHGTVDEIVTLVRSWEDKIKARTAR